MTEHTKHRLCALLAISLFLLASHMEYQDRFGDESGEYHKQ